MTVRALEFGTVSEFLGAVAWPVVTIVVVLVFLGPIRKLLERPDVSVKGPGGFAISAKSQQAATSALVNAAASRSQVTEPDVVETKVAVASTVVGSASRRPRLLWVDDRPSNNRYEKAAMEALDIVVDQSTSTDDALERMAKDGPYDVVVSDMGRPGDDKAGYTLLDKLRADGNRTPFVVYSGSGDPQHYDEAVAHGAIGSTDRPTELLDMVAGAVRAAEARKTQA